MDEFCRECRERNMKKYGFIPGGDTAPCECIDEGDYHSFEGVA